MTLLKPLFILYKFLIYTPFMIVHTLITCLMVLLLSIVFRSKYLAGLWLRYIWGRVMIYMLFCRVKIHGKQHLDKKTSAVYIANHQSSMDIHLLYGWLLTDFRWVMKEELMKIPIFGHACKAMGHIGVDRGNAKKSAQSMDSARSTLINGVSVVFFPEGSRSKVGQVQRFKTGAFRLAKDLQLPIVPISIKGAYKLVANSLYYPLGTTLELTFHPAISIEDVQKTEMKELMDTCKQTISSQAH